MSFSLSLDLLRTASSHLFQLFYVQLDAAAIMTLATSSNLQMIVIVWLLRGDNFLSGIIDWRESLLLEIYAEKARNV